MDYIGPSVDAPTSALRKIVASQGNHFIMLTVMVTFLMCVMFARKVFRSRVNSSFIIQSIVWCIHFIAWPRIAENPTSHPMNSINMHRNTLVFLGIALDVTTALMTDAIYEPIVKTFKSQIT